MDVVEPVEFPDAGPCVGFIVAELFFFLPGSVALNGCGAS